MSELHALNCREIAERVTVYLEGILPDAERHLLEEHLADCSDCEHHLDQMRRTIAITGTLRDDEVPLEARRRLIDLYRAWKARSE
jgi:anti-sigma factor RsiW